MAIGGSGDGSSVSLTAATGWAPASRSATVSTLRSRKGAHLQWRSPCPAASSSSARRARSAPRPSTSCARAGDELELVGLSAERSSDALVAQAERARRASGSRSPTRRRRPRRGGVDGRRGARRRRGARAARRRVRRATSCSTRSSARRAWARRRALGEGIDLALANKESLVVGGELVMALAEATGAQIIPVDSEHSALHQLDDRRAARRGGAARADRLGRAVPRPQRATSCDGVTVEEALRHPTWAMGGKITIDSATLMNKGLELIEAHHLFGMPYERIDVVVHPQSIVHALVELCDGADARAPRPSRHARADLLRAALPRARRRAGRAARPRRGGRAHVRGARSRTFACLRLAREAARPAAPRRACSTPRTRSPCTRSSRAGCASSGIAEVIERDAGARCPRSACMRSRRSTRPIATLRAAAARYADGRRRRAAMSWLLAFVGFAVADRPARGRALRRREGGGHARGALRALLPAAARAGTPRGDGVRDRRRSRSAAT